MNIDNISRILAEYPDPKECISEIPDELDVLGFGSLRITVRDPENKNKVIKFGIGHGVNHNKNEVRVYNKSKKLGINGELAEIYEYDDNYKWIRMQYVGDTDDDLEKFSGENAKKIRDKLASSGIKMRELETTYYNNQYIAYDYGAISEIK